MLSSQEFDKRLEDRTALRSLISQWNANRLDLFALSEPNEELEFHGVMRFYFQDADQRVVTKCLRVASSATVRDVVPTLIEKFRPDIRMLSSPDYSQYALYEIHENGDERKLVDDERPLVVQLRWHEDDREGRFLFRRMDAKSHLPRLNEENSLRFQKKRMSKREKKKLAKKQAESASQIKENGKEKIAQKLYSEMPETSFTRSISNPEAVMRRRRQQKLERKLQQFREESAALGMSNTVCGPGAGGTLRIFGESLNKDVPYKTLLLSTQDTAAHVVREMLEKYGMDNEDPMKYCLVQVFVQHPPNGAADGSLPIDSSLVKEYILDDDDCPLAIERQHNRLKGTLSFHIRRRPHDYQPRKRKKKTKNAQLPEGMSVDKLPYLQEIHASHDGSSIEEGAVHRLLPDMTEIGGAGGIVPPHPQSLVLPGLLPRHCVIAHTQGGIVTVTPSGDPNAETFLNGQRIRDTTILQHGAILKLGKLHTFRFVDPAMAAYPPAMQNPQPQRIDPMGPRPASVSGEYQSKADRHLSTNSDGSQIDAGQHMGHPQQGRDPILPAVLEFWEEHENVFLDSVISRLDPAKVQFKLAPTYTLYMAARYRASTHFRPECSPNERAHRLTQAINKVATLIHRCVEERCNLPSSSSAQYRVHCLSFWLANASELLNFLKNDRHLSAYTLDAQDMLAESVRLCFSSLVSCLQADLDAVLPSFVRNPADATDVDGAIADVINVLAGSMTLLKRCRVNAALTIQLFSQLFHFLNMWLFNETIKSAFSSQPTQNMCHRLWGLCLKRRLAKVVTWADKQGLELAADCHLSRIIQAAHLLQTQKSTDNVAELSQSCVTLNSLQLRTMLERYRVDSENGEPPLPSIFIEQICKMAESREAANPEQDIRLEEDSDLQLPFLLPEDGYTCETIRGVPAGLAEFLTPLTNAGLCRLTLQPSSIGLWTIYMSDQDIHIRAMSFSRGDVHNGSHEEEMIYNQPPAHPQPIPSAAGQQRGGFPPQVAQGMRPQMPHPEICTLYLKKLKNSMGLSIIAAKGYGQEHLGIYVKSIVPGGAADIDGRLQAGDHLLKVDGQSLIGMSQDTAAQLMTHTGEVACLEVAKQGAIFHGLGGLLQQSPMGNRESIRRMSDRDAPSRLAMAYPGSQFDRNAHTLPSMSSMQHQQSMAAQRHMQESKSVPHLNYQQASAQGVMGSQGYPPSLVDPQGHVDGGGRTASVSSLPNHYEQHKLPQQPMGQMGGAPMGRPQHAPPLGPKPIPVSHQQPLQPRRSVDYDYGESVYQNIDMYQQPMHMQQAQQPHGQYMAHMYGQQQMAGPPQQVPGMPANKPAQPAANMHQSAIYGQYQLQAKPPPPAANYGPSPVHYENHPVGMGLPAGSSQYNPPTAAQVGPANRLPNGGVGAPQPGYHQKPAPNRGGSPSRLPPMKSSSQWQETTIMETVRGGMTVRSSTSVKSANQLRADAKMDEMREEVNRRPMRQHPQPQPMQPHARQGQQMPPQQQQQQMNNNRPEPRKVEIKDRYEGVGQAMPLAPNGILGRTARERDEKERREQERLEERLAAIDAEIEELEQLPQRDEKQDERLRCLRLEREFQRRAMEGDERDDEEDLAARRQQDQERMLKIQENIEKARLQHQQQQQQFMKTMDDAAQQREQEQTAHHADVQDVATALETVTLAVGEEDLDDVPPPLPRSPPPPLDPPTTQQPLQSVLKNSNGVLNSPSKGNLKYPSVQNNNNDSNCNYNTGDAPANPPAKKKVSFHETHTEVSYDNYEDDFYDDEEEEMQMMENEDFQQQMAMHGIEPIHHVAPQHDQQAPPQEALNGVSAGVGAAEEPEAEKYTLEDIDEVLNQPQLTFSPQAPGVIGSQEVYRDPRQRIISAKQSQKESSPPVGPEKLTFQEKMKMFANEVGERTPKTKTSLSKAQREIDHLATPTTH